MKRFLLIVVGLALVSAVIYLVSTNGTVTDFQLTPNLTLSYSLGGLMVASFLTGAVTVLIGVMVQAGGRAIVGWRQQRRERKHQRVVQMEERGEQLMWQGDAKHGRALLEKAYRRQPENAYAVLALASSYRATGESARERQFLTDAATQHHHTNPDVLLALASAHAFAGDRQQALEVLERLRALHPKAPRVLAALRDAYLSAGRWQEAIGPQEVLVAETREASQATKEREALTTMRYMASLGLEDTAQRIEALEGLADRRSMAVPVAVSLGDALLEAGRRDEAIGVWERALRSTPQTVLAERVASNAADTSARNRLCNVLRKLRPDAVDMDRVRVLIASQHLVEDQVSEAAEEIALIESERDAGPMLGRLRGEIHRRRGELQQAVEAFAGTTGSVAGYQWRQCGRAADTWSGVCPCCHSWDSSRARTEIARG